MTATEPISHEPLDGHKSEFQSLPTELLRAICSYLPTSSVPSFRLLCVGCAAIGDEYLLPKIHFHVDEKQIARLEAISEHPAIAKNITEFHYHAFLLPFKPLPMSVSKGGFTYGISDASHPDQIPPEKYRAYQKAVIAQKRIMSTRACYKALIRLFARTNSLKSAVFSFSYDDSTWTSITGFYEAWAQDAELHAIGGLVTMIQAMAECSTRLIKFEAGPLSWRAFKSVRLRESLGTMFGASLKELRFCISVHTNGAFDGDQYEQARTYFESSQMLIEFVDSFRNLTTLHLHIDLDHEDLANQHVNWPVELSNIDDGVSIWQCLSDLSLSGIKCGQSELVDFLQRHSSTLQNLALSDICLYKPTDSWCTFLPEVKSSVSLKTAKISGTLTNGQGECWRLAPPEWCKVGMVRKVEKYLLFGGDVPLTRWNMNDEEDTENDDDDDDGDDVSQEEAYGSAGDGDAVMTP